MGIFDFLKHAGSKEETPEEQDRRAAEAKAASQAARAEAQREAAAKAAQSAAKGAEGAAKAAQGGATGAQAGAGKTAQGDTAVQDVSEAILERKIKASKIDVKDLSLKLEGEKVKVYGVVSSPEDKADLILLIGNTQGIAKVDDAIKVRKPGSEKDEENVPAPRLYQVKSGDTLSAIAQKELGSADRYMEIFNANRNILRDPDEIDIGQTLRIPNK